MCDYTAYEQHNSAGKLLIRPVMLKNKLQMGYKNRDMLAIQLVESNDVINYGILLCFVRCNEHEDFRENFFVALIYLSGPLVQKYLVFFKRVLRLG